MVDVVVVHGHTYLALSQVPGDPRVAILLLSLAWWVPAAVKVLCSRKAAEIEKR